MRLHFAEIFVHSFPQATSVGTTIHGMINAEISGQGQLFSSTLHLRLYSQPSYFTLGRHHRGNPQVTKNRETSVLGEKFSKSFDLSRKDFVVICSLGQWM